MATQLPELVGEVLELTGLAADTPVTLDKLGDVPLGQALSEHFEIARPSREALALIAERSGNPELKQLLSSERKAQLNEWLWGRQLADVLHAYPIDCGASELLGTFKRLQPRLYSIASSPKVNPCAVDLTVAAVRYGKRKGVSSTFLADRAEYAEVPVFLQQSKHFRPPVDGSVPMIMIGPGTGVAPFRGFLQERQARGDPGRNWLFFGEQHAASDFYYREELQAMQRDGLLTHLSLAFSATRRRKSMFRTAFWSKAPSSGAGCKKARSCISVAMPAAWPRMSIMPCARLRNVMVAWNPTLPLITGAS